MFGKKKEHDEEYYRTHMTDEEVEQAKAKISGKERRKLKDTFMDAMENASDQSAMSARKKYFPRWRKLCDIEEDDIETFLMNPQVRVEWYICDPKILRELIHGNRAPLMEKLTEEEQLIYLTGCDGEGRKYTEIENTNIKGAIGQGLKLYRQETKVKRIK